MLTICLCVTPAPVQERGWILDLLRTDQELHRPLLGKGKAWAAIPYVSREPRWVILPRRFACKRHALQAVRREIRTGKATAAKLYWGGTLQGYWQKCPKTGRELKMPRSGSEPASGHVADEA